MTKKIAIIDGYGFVFRAYHSLPPLTNPSGVPVGAVYGFTNMLIKLMAGLNVTHMAIALDSGSKTFRHEIFSEYKANRPECPEDLKPQFPIIRQTAQALNIATLEKSGFEADDIIATLAKKSAKQGFEVLIVSSDKDLMQLVNDKVFMYDAMRNRFIGEKEVEEKFFVKPKQVLDVLSLIGDSSDNVPGVRGVGPKTAAELILQFGNLENLLQNYQEIKQERKKELIAQGIENAKLSKSLITLDDKVDLNLEPENFVIQAFDPLTLINFLQEHGFRSLMTRIKKEFNIDDSLAESQKNDILQTSEVEQTINKIEIFDEKTSQKLLEQTIEKGSVTIDYNVKDGMLDVITISPLTSKKEVNIYFFNLDSQVQDKEDELQDLFSQKSNIAQLANNSKFGLEVLLKLLSDDSIKKIFFDFKNFYNLALKLPNIRKFLSEFKDLAFEDLHLINHLLTSSTKSDLRQLIDLNLNTNIEESGYGQALEDISKNKEPEFFNELTKKIDFLIFKNNCLSQLYQIFAPQIFKQKLNQAYISYEKPLLLVLAQIEFNGVKIDITKMKELSDQFSQKINQLTSQIHQLAGQEFNIASTKQLSEILFDKMGLTSSKKSKKTGALSTKSSVLEEMSLEGNEIADKILDFRKFSKLKNTYTDALPKEINPQTNRIHSHFSSSSTITGRLSSSNPNLQNIPIRSHEGKQIRQAFIAQNGNILISADYSQIELRILAHMAKIENLVQAFKEDKDIHKITASQVFGVSENEVNEDLRSKAKAINFGIIYGISGFGLARQLKISRSEASEYIKNYLKTYPGIDNFMKNYIDFARTNGFVQTISGRKCFIHEINSKNPIIRGEAERLAINAPIQGSAADLIKKAMIKLSNHFKKDKIPAQIIMQIHDELIIETAQQNQELVSKIIKSEMENAFILDLPLKVDISCGQNW